MISMISAPPAYGDLEAGAGYSTSDGPSNDQLPPEYQPVAELSIGELRAAYERSEYQLQTLERIHMEERRRIQQELELARQRYMNAVSVGSEDLLSLSDSVVTIIETQGRSQRLRRTQPSPSFVSHQRKVIEWQRRGWCGRLFLIIKIPCCFVLIVMVIAVIISLLIVFVTSKDKN